MSIYLVILVENKKIIELLSHHRHQWINTVPMPLELGTLVVERRKLILYLHHIVWMVRGILITENTTFCMKVKSIKHNSAKSNNCK